MLPDNRVRLPGPPIDFTNDVGDTGKAHDTFPSPGPVRFDHLRSYLIGLLANQASYLEPVEFRFGTLWLDQNVKCFKFRNSSGAVIEVAGDQWISLAHGIEVEPGLTLAQWFSQVSEIFNTDITEDTSIFSRLTKARADEPITAGSLVYVSSSRHVAKADSTSAVRKPAIGATTITVDTGGETIIKHVGLASVRMKPGLILNPGDQVYLDTDGRGTNTASDVQLIGVVFDSDVYDGAAADPVAGVILVPVGVVEIVTGGGSAGGLEQIFIAGSGIALGDIVYKNTTADQVVPADASALSTSNTVVGVAEANAGALDDVTIVNGGIVVAKAETGISITPGQVVYLSTQAGRATNVAPSASGEVVLVVGISKNSTSIPGSTFEMSWQPRVPVVVP